MSRLSADYQEWQKLTSWYYNNDKQNTGELVYLALGIAGEGGEFADQVKKLVREHGDRGWEDATSEQVEKLTDELADVLWYVVRTCTMLDITLDDLLVVNMVKLYNRLQVKDTPLKRELGEIPWGSTQLTPEEANFMRDRILGHISGTRELHNG